MGYSYGGSIKLDLSIDFTSKAPLDIRMSVTDYEDLALLENPYVGLITYVKSKELAYICKSVKITGEHEWIPIKGSTAGGIFVGPNAPDTSGMSEAEIANLLWVDTSHDESLDNWPTHESAETYYSLRKAYFQLKEEVNILKNLVILGVIPGNIKDSARNKMRWNIPEIVPKAYLDTLLNDGYVYDTKTGKIYEYIPLYDDNGEFLYPYDEYNKLIIDVYEDDLVYDPGDANNTVEEKPSYPVDSEPTVPHVCVKYGTYEELLSNLLNFINGELLWCTGPGTPRMYIYMNGTLKTVGNGSGTADPGTGDNNTMTETEIKEFVKTDILQNIDNGVTFIPADEKSISYKIDVDRYGNLKIYNSKLDIPFEKGSADYVWSAESTYCALTGVVISTFYLGGLNNDEHSYQPCSHNFVELANVSMKKSTGEYVDVNLNGFSLCYFDGTSWHELPLKGEIKGGETYLIRGAQCSVMDANTTKIKVKTFDQEWLETSLVVDGDKFVESTYLMKFNLDQAAFYLVYTGPDHEFYEIDDATPKANGIKGLSTTTNNLINVKENKCANGFADLVGFNSIFCEKSTFGFIKDFKYTASDVIFRRWYFMDPVTLSNPKDGISSHNNVKYMTATLINGGTIPDYMKPEDWTPKASFEHRTMASTRSCFGMENKPQILTCTFGCQATYKDEQHPATRGFAWVSEGFYNEYIAVRKKGEGEYKKFYSLNSPVSSDETSGSDIRYSVVHSHQSTRDYYLNMRWETPYGESVTSHRIILTGFEAGVYEYKVGRDNSDYESDTRTFTVRTDDDVNKGFSFIQTTDQQGASWEEYEVWSLSAEVIKNAAEASKDEDNDYSDFNFIINTGDICYNGSRPNEWIDYFRGYAPLKDKEEMLTIGNNDLAPINMYDIGTGGESPWKINVNVIDYFYAVEMDVDNPAIFTACVPSTAAGNEFSESAQTNTFKMPSLYSFNYGKYHFVSILSEIRTGSNKTTVDDSGNASASNLKETTVTAIFGVKDFKRKSAYGAENSQASNIYDIQERWVIKDLMKWKGCSDLELQNANTADLMDIRFNESIVGKCQHCFMYIHEMPFNIISDTSYTTYAKQGAIVPRETAKAYLNRQHNFEYQRSFKTWGIKMVLGGHKHTVAMTRAVYDAPLGYNPITKSIRRTTDNDLGPTAEKPEVYKWDDEIFNDYYADTLHGTEYLNKNGQFSYKASFMPFLLLTPDEMTATGHWNLIKQYCSEIYNNTEKPITFPIDDTGETKTLEKKEATTISIKGIGGYNGIGDTGRPAVRVEVVDKITAPYYVMCQATGFKNKSNSDLAASTSGSSLVVSIIPWEYYYVPGNNTYDLCFPYYTVYHVKDDANDNTEIRVNMMRIEDMYNNPTGGTGAGYWDLMKIYLYDKDSLETNRQTVINNCKVKRYSGAGAGGEIIIK